MENIKSFLIVLISISFVIQIGNLILDKTAFSKIFKVISGIILIVGVLQFVNGLLSENNISYSSKSSTHDYSTYDIKKSFENRLITSIKEDLHKMNYVNIDVDVETNFKTLKIYISGIQDAKSADNIKEYIKEKYCTLSDEVIINGETS